MKYRVILSILGILLLFASMRDQDQIYYQVNNENPLEVKTLKPSLGTVWAPNGTAISTAINNQWETRICSDGAGGAYITWVDERSYYDIYAQYIDSNGAIKWAADGIGICTENAGQGSPQICSDGEGGAIIVWQDARFGSALDIYTQKIDSNGEIKWGINGTLICNATGQQIFPQLCSDDSGGAIITWEDRRSGNDIYAQWIYSNGTIKLAENGVLLCQASGNQVEPQICSDGLGGAIVAWIDARSGIDADIYAQRIGSNGVIRWGANGTVICNASDQQTKIDICSDKSGGAVVVWEDRRNLLSTAYDIYCHRVDSNGTTKWADNGVAICTVNEWQRDPQICADGTGGAIITWEDGRSTTSLETFAQRVDSNGAIKWTANGIPICPGGIDQADPQICSDGAGGAIIAFEDWRNKTTDQDIYAQRIDPTGILKWGSNGIAVCTSVETQSVPHLCSDKAGGAIITWLDLRSGLSSWDIYAQHIEDEVIPAEIIPFGNFYLLFSILSILFIIIAMKNRIITKFKK